MAMIFLKSSYKYQGLPLNQSLKNILKQKLWTAKNPSLPTR